MNFFVRNEELARFIKQSKTVAVGDKSRHYRQSDRQTDGQADGQD